MEHKLTPTFEASSSSHTVTDPSQNLNQNHPFAQLNNPRNPSYNPEFSTLNCNSDHEVKGNNNLETGPQNPDWDPRAILTNLVFLEQKIHQIQEMVKSIVAREGQVSIGPNEVAAQQQLVTTDLTCIIIQLILTAGTLLPSIKNTLVSGSPSIGQLGNVLNSSTKMGLESSTTTTTNTIVQQNREHDESIHSEDHDVKDSEDGVDGENLPPSSYEVLQLEKEEILAPHSHFCSICGKGFKRDANLRMHMRGHGDEYKTPAALAKPMKDLSAELVPTKRYACPFVGCKRNKEHKKFQPLKTILCVKNHYKRSHCDKSYTCSRCNSKKFSVIADLKTHEKHCGRYKWLCSCGTTFSRKDKLFGHVALFQGHTPALPIDEPKSSEVSDRGQSSEALNGIESMGYTSRFMGNSMDELNVLDIKSVDDDLGYFSLMNFDSCNFGTLDEFSRQFDMGENSFLFLPVGSNNFVQKDGDNANSSHLR